MCPHASQKAREKERNVVVVEVLARRGGLNLASKISATVSSKLVQTCLGAAIGI